ncbi:MAG: HEPN domain-containing protein [Bacteroidota bacterium]
MNPFATTTAAGPLSLIDQEKLVGLIREHLAVEMVYLLGISVNSRITESLFKKTDSCTPTIADCYLLILVSEIQNKTLPEWQDQIEQHCNPLVPVTTIVLETNTFQKWLTMGHLFARTVYASATRLYQAENLVVVPVGSYDRESEQRSIEKQFGEGLSRSQEFMAGAELFRLRNHNRLSAFMLHQSAEQALGTLLKTQTGYYCCTHNIDRLIRYTGMVTNKLAAVFPRNTDPEKRLFTLLQRAYIDCRYREDYKICNAELLCLMESVKRIQEIVFTC